MSSLATLAAMIVGTTTIIAALASLWDNTTGQHNANREAEQ